MTTLASAATVATVSVQTLTVRVRVAADLLPMYMATVYFFVPTKRITFFDHANFL